MTNKQNAEGITYRLSDLYYEMITGKQFDEDLFHSLVEQLKKEGYNFEPLHNNDLLHMYEKQDKQLADLAYFTLGEDKTIIFICARGLDLDGWIWSNMHTNIQLKIDRLNTLYSRIIANRYVDEDIDTEQFKNLVRQLKSLGFKFRIAETETTGCAFNTDSVGNWIDFTPGNHPIDAYMLM